MSPQLLTRLARWGAWLLLAALAVVTLGPAGVRPVTGAPVSLEHMLAFAALGGAFTIGYPRRLPWVIGLIFMAAILLELGQFLDPSRHGRMIDAVQKLIGGGLGIAVGFLLARWLTPRPAR